MKKRANILFMSDIGAGKPMVQSEIATRCGVSGVTVFNTLRDYCTEGLDYTLSFKRTKATNPAIVTGDIEARIVALACGKSPDGSTRWTVRLLTEKIVELNILDTVSRETVRTTLKNTT
jgi:transposase